MKKFVLITLALASTAALLTACNLGTLLGNL